ncbi:MAG: GNAT family N-acetyltransferase [Pleurocapsa sp. MO_226.B13]|nr:GNAT family N-acetyltransferase [Pleurocapsa sp. MO_226.B13]
MTVLTLENPIKQQNDLQNILSSIVLAFCNDPIARWIYYSPQQYLYSFPSLVTAFAGKAFDSGTVYYSQSYSGAAFWFPPQIHPDLDAVVRGIRLTITPEKRDSAIRMLKQRRDFHPCEPHWYLALLGVKPTQQHRGYGSASIRPILDYCDRYSQLAYVEASNLANLPFFEKHGFEAIGKIQIADSPTLFPMVRYPKNLWGKSLILR